MPRFARIYYPQGIFHIVSRTFNREFLIAGQEERNYYLGLLEESLKKTDALLLSWCLMSNHIHLVVRAGADPLSRLMKSVHSGFA
ncbi:MAG: transposase, partial [Proteobacteria bacterium]|nr:transposase [Pseudomonadota bacterium]